MLKCIKDSDIIFICETKCSFDALPPIQGYSLICDHDYNKPYGGIAAYVKTPLYAQICKTEFYTSYLLLEFSHLPYHTFFGVYIQPSDSKYFETSLFSELASRVSDCIGKGNIPFIGGDINSRIGDINVLANEVGLKWKYSTNVDTQRNTHYTFLRDLCVLCKTLPINHLMHNNINFSGDYTFTKDTRKSQVDFLLTNSSGRKCITKFEIVKTGFHLSDHLPISTNIKLKYYPSLKSLILRSSSLADTLSEHCSKPSQSRVMHFDTHKVIQYLENSSLYEDLEQSILSGNIETSIEVLHNHMHLATRKFKYTTRNSFSPLCDDITQAVKKCDHWYNEYIQQTTCNKEYTGEKPYKCNKEHIGEKPYQCNVENTGEKPYQCNLGTDLGDIPYKEYQKSRKNLYNCVGKAYTLHWRKLETNNDGKQLWNSINWKGEFHNQRPPNAPDIVSLKKHFEELYSTHADDQQLISELQSDVYIPVLDDPINSQEIDEAVAKMKKGGYDYTQQALNVMLQVAKPLIILIMNMIFSLAFPMKLASAMLSALPKKGNLSLTKNYRGIQCSSILTNLYDRIIANRLIKWSSLSYEQTAYQKGRSTIDQLFLLRLIIELAKKLHITLYIGTFDLSKAFDIVSRFRMISTLVHLGVGSAMLYAIKQMYKVTKCTLRFFGNISEEFETKSGIRQGAASSCILFIIYMDKIVSYIASKCVAEPLLGTLHTLLHADDTLIISTSRTLFINKCNAMINFFDDEYMILNMSKSGFMIINPGNTDYKTDIVIQSRILKYKPKQVYLGQLFTDSGNISHDILQMTNSKAGNITIKLQNFLNKNFFAPYSVKKHVLEACINSSLTYGCEAWSYGNISSINTLHRKSIKMILGIGQTITNHII